MWTWCGYVLTILGTVEYISLALLSIQAQLLYSCRVIWHGCDTSDYITNFLSIFVFHLNLGAAGSIDMVYPPWYALGWLVLAGRCYWRRGAGCWMLVRYIEHDDRDRGAAHGTSSKPSWKFLRVPGWTGANFGTIQNEKISAPKDGAPGDQSDERVVDIL